MKLWRENQGPQKYEHENQEARMYDRVDSESHFAIFLVRILWRMSLTSHENIVASLARLMRLARREKFNILQIL